MKSRASYLLVAVGVVALALVVVGWTLLREDGSGRGVDEWSYVSEPDLVAPVIDVTRPRAKGADPTAGDGLVFLGPKDGESMTGPLIVDGAGDPVWIGPDERTYDVRVQRYRGQQVLTYWRGDTVQKVYGAGEFVLLNNHYQEIGSVTTRGILKADYHDGTLTDRGTALLIGHRVVRRTVPTADGPRDIWIADGVVQEVDVATGKVLFQWSALKHIPLSQSMVALDAYGAGTRAEPHDYAHLNSVTEYGDDLLISARNTSAIYRVDRDTGKIVWTLGGKDSDFRMRGGSRFFWQHDAQLQADGTITMFDNEASPPRAKRSRGLRLALDPKTRTARVVAEYLPPKHRRAASQGNLQVLPNGRVFIGWGSRHYYSEYTADGDLLLDADFGTGESYRAYRMRWVGRPTQPPSLAVRDGAAYVSWNGATEVASWRFLAGRDAAHARPVATTPRTGFETSAPVPARRYLAVQALDAEGHVLATATR